MSNNTIKLLHLNIFILAIKNEVFGCWAVKNVFFNTCIMFVHDCYLPEVCVPRFPLSLGYVFVIGYIMLLIHRLDACVSVCHIPYSSLQEHIVLPL